MHRNARVLIVDDEPDVQLLCRVNLEFEGYRVRLASDGLEALARIAEERPDVVLLDVMMPRMDGWEVLERIKSDPALADLPVVLLTARSHDDDQIRGWTGGAADYITKPFSPLQLSTALHDVLQATVTEEADRREHLLRQLRALQRA